MLAKCSDTDMQKSPWQGFSMRGTYLEAEPVLTGEGVHGLLLETLLAL